MGFPAFQGQMACLECRVSQDRKDPREGKVQKDRSVIRDHKECRVQEETEGAKASLGRVDPQEWKAKKVKREWWEWKEREALWEIKEEKETKERKEKAPKQVKQV